MIREIRNFIKNNAGDISAVIGLGLVSVGSAWVYPPAGLIVPGMILIIDAILRNK